MKKVLYSVLFAAIAGVGFTACSNGDYNANPNSAANASINPLSPLSVSEMQAFATNHGPNYITATVNGGTFTATGDTAAFYRFDTGYHFITGFSGGKYLSLDLSQVYAGSIYTMGHNIVNRLGIYYSFDTSGRSLSYFASSLGNSGEVYILQNDDTIIRGTFYFQAVDTAGNVINVNNGYFNMRRN